MTPFGGFGGMAEAFPMSLIHASPWLSVDRTSLGISGLLSALLEMLEKSTNHEN